MYSLISIFALILMTFNYSPKIINYHLRERGIRDSISNIIVIHYDDGTNSKHTLKYLRRSGKSYHYYITKNGLIYKLIDPKYKAYHAGKSEWNGMNELNDYSIGICFENDGVESYTYKQYLSGAWLINKLKHRYRDINDSKIVGHSEVAYPENRKHDPGDKFDWNTFYTLIHAYNNEKTMVRRSKNSPVRGLDLGQNNGRGN